MSHCFGTAPGEIEDIEQFGDAVTVTQTVERQAAVRQVVHFGQSDHGLDHAAACGTLLSHLQTQSEEKQKEFLTALEDLRENGQRWSELKREPRQKEAQSQANH